MEAPTPTTIAAETAAKTMAATAAQETETSAPRAPPASVTLANAPTVNVGAWSTEEHERYLQAKFANPKASWKEIAQLVGTRSARQVILHDQKFRAKMERRRSKTERSQHLLSIANTAEPGLRYFDSMGVLLLASVASSRTTKIETPDTAQAEDARSTSTGLKHEPA